MGRFFSHETVLRVVALILACTIWLAVNAPNSVSSPTTTATTAGIAQKYPYPVHVLVSPDRVVTSVSSTTAEIIVSGNIQNLTTLPAQMADVSVAADATGLAPGKHSVPLTVVNMPPVNHSIQPLQVDVVVEPKVSVNKPVTYAVQGSPAADDLVGTPTGDVLNAVASGSKSAVARVASIVATVSIQNAAETVTKSVDLVPVGADRKPLEGVEVTPARATVTVPIKTPVNTADLVPQIIGNPAPGYAISGIEMTPKLVKVYGVSSATPTAQTASVGVPIDVSGLRKSQTMRVQLPLDAGLSKIEPSTLSIRVFVEKSVTKQVSGIPIHVVNPVTNEQVAILGNAAVDVSVSGPKSRVTKLTAKDISAFIDASKLSPSATAAPINVTVPDWVQVTQMSRNVTNVKVTQTAKQ